jgi:hypothetical protein
VEKMTKQAAQTFSLMEKAGLERSRYKRRFGGILISRLIGTRGRPGAKVPVAALALTTAAISVLAAALIFPPKIIADDDQVRTFTVDVALGLPFFQNDIDPTEGQDVFSPGDTFIQYGNIYPKGTIPNGRTDFDPDTPGAIGKYLVRGTWTTDFANFERAAAKDSSAAPDLAFATEMFSFGNDRAMILTDGLYPNAYFSAGRVVLGGTCRFRGIVGEVHEENIGENVRGFCNFRVTFRLKKAAAEHGR